MGATKSHHFTLNQNNISLICKALGHPARIAIIEHLLKTNACICGDLVDELPLSQATISQHLKELKSAGIIKGTIEGNAICYCIDNKSIEKLLSYFTKIKAKTENLKNNCC